MSWTKRSRKGIEHTEECMLHTDAVANSRAASGSFQARTGSQCCTSAISEALGISSSLVWDQCSLPPHLTCLGLLSRHDAIIEVL